MISTIQPIDEPPVRIRALGGFLVTTPNAPEGVRTRSRSKPLELLKLLIAHGGDGLSVQQVVDTLWPDADGDRGQWSFATTLRRLRTLVDAELLDLHNARLSLNRERCWLDVLEFSGNLATTTTAMDAGDTSRAEYLLREALQLYQGPLLAGESEAPLVVEARDRLHSTLLREVQRLGGLLQKQGAHENAISLYNLAIGTDASVEWLYQELMHSLSTVGRQSEALATHERCRRNLKTHLGVQPGLKTETLRQTLETAPTERWRELPSLAVLPFESQLPKDGDYAVGIAYDLRLALQKISGLVVYGHPTVPDGEDTTTACLQAQYVLRGTVRRNAQHVRITATLMESANGKQVWGERYDRMDDGLHTVLDEIVEEIVTGLQVELVEGEQARIWNRALRNPQAREQFYQGVAHFWRMNPEQLVLARERFREVIELEPNSVLGYGYTAWTHLFDMFLGFSTDLERSRALAAEFCQRALDIDVDGLSLHSLRSHLHLLAGEGEQAIACGLTALQLRPSCSIAYAFMAHTLLYLGRPREAITRLQMAFRLGRVSPPWYHELLGWSYLVIGFNDQAAAAARIALQGDPERVESQLILATAMHAQGRVADAHACMEGLWRGSPDFNLWVFVAAKPGKGPDLLRQVLAWVQSPGD